ncbi:transcription factor e(y)2-domain-containing protein [Irpex rosettiformis]|uniref:Transcription factor e(Y)2-domain-containing protein n=1 Tax=Irpex rosettiformis TaxID=378272 RepID=A0ACB8UE27_9APHY|nr:transcription factor e(y)2-domain-containing protein [Irpex rosettiformis]
MPSRNDPANSALYTQLHRRMVESGEWDRLSTIFSQRLTETGWVDDVHHRSKEIARSAGSEPGKTVRQIMTDVQEYAEGSVPASVRQGLMALIRQYLDSQIDK